MKKVLFDELSFILTDKEKEQFEEENGYTYDWVEESHIEFDSLFNNKNDQKKYVVTGSVGCWDGTRPNAYMDKVYNSISEAIMDCYSQYSQVWMEVYEENYGKLSFHLCHHDANDWLEVKEVTKLGCKLLDEKSYNVGRLLKRKGTTRNVKYIKNYLQ